jgi:hypothetical protein
MERPTTKYNSKYQAPINYLEEMKVTEKSLNSSLEFGETIEPAGDSSGMK